MEPQQSLQPDPADDDPDQDADPPPPNVSPAILGNALSLVAQPLASAAARVAASHQPIALPIDDLHDFNVDLSWAGSDLDSLFLNDTQYLQLGDDEPFSSDVATMKKCNPDHPTPPNPEASASATHPENLMTSATETITDPNAEVQHRIKTPSSTAPILSSRRTENVPAPSPSRRVRPSPVTQKRARSRLNQPMAKHNAIPIAPRAVSKPKNLSHLKPKSTPPTPRSMRAQSSPLDTTRLQPGGAVHSPDCSPSSGSRDSGPNENPAKPLNHFPLGIPSHPIVPLMNMYPLQHHHSIFQPSPTVLSTANPNTPDSKVLRLPATANPSDAKRVRLSDVDSPASTSHHRSQEQPFLSPTMQVMPQSVVPYDASMVPLFQMARQVYAAAAAGYPQGIIPQMPAGSPNIPSTLFTPFGANRTQPVQADNERNIQSSGGDSVGLIQLAHNLAREHEKTAHEPVVVQEDGTQVLVPQQKAARLERHPVLGRLQLKSPAKPQVATSSAMQERFVSETQPPAGESQQRTVLGQNRGTPPNSRPSSSLLSSHDSGQRQQKQRLVWTPELHDRFVKAINAVGLNQAVPKTLITIMNVEGLTTEHVKSHLQKYRNSLRKEAAEDARDRSRGAGPSAMAHNSRLGTPGASGASVIIATAVGTTSGSAAKRAEPQGNGATDGATQGLPILPSRISAFGDHMRSLTQTIPDSGGGSACFGNPIPSHQGRKESNMQRVSSSSPRSPSMRSPRLSSTLKGIASGLDSIAQPSQSTVQPIHRNSKAAAKIEAGTFDPEDNHETPSSEGRNAIQSGRYPVPRDRVMDMASAVDSPSKPPSEDDLRRTPHEMGVQISRTTDSGTNAKQGKCVVSTKVGNGENRTVESQPGELVSNSLLQTQGSRDLELELIKEKTLQMQLQVQMMVHRTIALEKKLEEIHSERLDVEASDTADASKRSAVGNVKQNRSQGGNEEIQDATEAQLTASANSTRRDRRADLLNGKQEATDENDITNEKVLKKKRSHPSANSGQSEVKALRSVQMGLMKGLEANKAMIEKRMKREGVENTKSNKRGETEQVEPGSEAREDR